MFFRKDKDYYRVGVKRKIFFLFKKFRVVHHETRTTLGDGSRVPPFLYIRLKNGSEIAFHNLGSTAFKVYADYKDWVAKFGNQGSPVRNHTQLPVSNPVPPINSPLVDQALQQQAAQQGVGQWATAQEQRN